MAFPIHEIGKEGSREPFIGNKCFALEKTSVIPLAKASHMAPSNYKRTGKCKRAHEITNEPTIFQTNICWVREILTKPSKNF